MSVKHLPARQTQRVKYSDNVVGSEGLISGRDIERLVDSKPFYQSGHESDDFDATDFDKLNTGKYAGIVDLSGNVYIIYYHIDNELLLIHMSDDQVIYKIEAYKSDEVWNKTKYEFAMASQSELTKLFKHTIELGTAYGSTYSVVLIRTDYTPLTTIVNIQNAIPSSIGKYVSEHSSMMDKSWNFDAYDMLQDHCFFITRDGASLYKLVGRMTGAPTFTADLSTGAVTISSGYDILTALQPTGYTDIVTEL